MKRLKQIVSIIIALAMILSNNCIYALSNDKTEDVTKVNSIRVNKSNTKELKVKIEDENIVVDDYLFGINLNSSRLLGTGTGTTSNYNYVSGNIIRAFSSADAENDYFIKSIVYTNAPGHFEIIKHNIKNNSNETVYTSQDGLNARKRFVRDNIIYVEAINYTYGQNNDATEVKVIGFNVLTGQEVYNQTFEFNLAENDNYQTFAVDSKQRFYFVYDHSGVKVFSKTGTLIYDNIANPTDGTVQLTIHNVAPNDKGLIISVRNFTYSGSYLYLTDANSGFQELNADGSFKNTEYTLFDDISDANAYEIQSWMFLDDTHAVNQYGEIANFDYTQANGVEIELIDTTLRDLLDVFDQNTQNKPYCVNNNYLYLPSSEGIIHVFDMSQNYKRVGKIDFGVILNENFSKGGYDFLYRITCIDNQLYIYYLKDSVEKETVVSLNNIEEYKTITITDHITKTRTAQEIADKYNELSPKYDYSKTIFVTEPTYSAPYVVGELKQEVINDTLNQINYYRWLYGLKGTITANTDKMARSQKGAIVQAATDTLTHWPSQPEDMDDDFFAEAYIACGAQYAPGDWFNGNCASGDISTAQAVRGYIDELGNVSPDYKVGHRSNVLDLEVNRASFGYCHGYSTLSMYYNESYEGENDEEFYAYPSAGYFPMQDFNTNEYWSFYCTRDYSKSDLSIEFVYNNVSYPTTFTVESGKVIVFGMPNELKAVFGGANKQLTESTITVKLSGFMASNGDTVNYVYDVNFFDLNNVPEEPAQVTLGDVNNDGEIDAEDATLILRYYAGNIQLTQEQINAADVDNSGEVDAEDATLILRYYAGNILNF